MRFVILNVSHIPNKKFITKPLAHNLRTLQVITWLFLINYYKNNCPKNISIQLFLTVKHFVHWGKSQVHFVWSKVNADCLFLPPPYPGNTGLQMKFHFFDSVTNSSCISYFFLFSSSTRKPSWSQTSHTRDKLGGWKGWRVKEPYLKC